MSHNTKSTGVPANREHSLADLCAFSRYPTTAILPRTRESRVASRNVAVFSPDYNEETVMGRWLAHLAVFILVLAGLKFFFGWNISIIGSVVLTLIFGVIFALMDRR